MNSTLDDEENQSFCNKFYMVYDNYIEISILIIGIILNFICVIIFYKLMRNSSQNDNLNKYLLIKSIVDTLMYVHIMVIKSISLSKANKPYLYQVFRLIFFRYVLFILELMSMFLEIVSILNRYFTFTKINKRFEKFGFKSAMFLMSIYSFGFYAYRFFDEQIELVVDVKTNSTSYKLNSNKLDGISIIFDYIHSIVRDGICVLLIFILNILTLIKLKKVMKKKMNLQSKSIYKDKRLNETGFRLTKMVVATASITFFGHILTLIEYIFVNVIYIDDCFSAFSSFTFFSCNSFNFVLYYYFNLNFKRLFLSFVSYKNLFKLKC